jgi:hypothetical protein
MDIVAVVTEIRARKRFPIIKLATIMNGKSIQDVPNIEKIHFGTGCLKKIHGLTTVFVNHIT